MMRSSIAQAFDYLGQGLVLRGDPFQWNPQEQGMAAHLIREGANQLIQRTLAEYIKVTGIPPRRVVIHKSSEFWGHDHGEYDELEGFYEGIEAVFPKCESDLVALSIEAIRTRSNQPDAGKGIISHPPSGMGILQTNRNGERVSRKVG